MRLLPLFALLFSIHMTIPTEAEGFVNSLHLGFRYNSLAEKRGLVNYRDFQIDPVLTAYFWDKKLEFVGDAFGFKDFFYEDVFRFRTRLVSISDSPLFPNYESVRNTIVDRPTTYEWSNSFEFYLPEYLENYLGSVELNYSKDLARHYGNYLELVTKVKLFRFQAFGARLEPNLVTSVGYGDGRHNAFFYGPDDQSAGITDYSVGVWVALPDTVDRFYPVLRVKYFSALGDHRDKLYSRGRSEGVLFSFVAAINVLQ